MVLDKYENVNIRRLLYVKLTMELWQHLVIHLLTITYISFTIESITALVPMKEWNRCPSSDYKIETFWDVSVQACSKKCDVTQDCLSFKYFPRGRFCELLANDSWDEQSVTNKQPCHYGLRSKNQTKHVDKERDGNWSNTACGKAVVSNADVFGNIYTVGSRIKVTCHAGYQKENEVLPVECDIDGIWTNVPYCTRSNQNGATSFVFGFIKQRFSNDRSINIVASQPTKITYSVPLVNISEEITLANRSGLTLPVNIQELKDIGCYPYGFLLQSNTSVDVYIENSKSTNSDGTVVIPEKYLSRSYMLLSWNDNTNVKLQSEFAVVGTVDDTNMNIIFPNGSRHNLNINRYQLYHYQTALELTGTVISSSENVAVFAGQLYNSIVSDHLFEQMPPMISLQTEFIVSYPYPRYDYAVRIVAVEDGTKVVFSNGTLLTLNHGNYSQYQFKDKPIFIRASRPILVAMFSLGRPNQTTYWWGNVFDGSMLIVPGLSQFKSKYNIFVPENVVKSVLMVTYPSYLSNIQNIRLNHEHLISNNSVDVTVKQRGIYTVLYTELFKGFSVIYTTDGTPFGAYLSFFRKRSESWFSLPYRF